MYIPKINLETDQNEILDFMKKFSFGTIITSKHDKPVGTHLPFSVKTENDKILITSHFAKNNPQWKDINECEILIIFNEPHSYISPSNYETQVNVPTWNYISVHVYGKGRIIQDPEETTKILETSINQFEPNYMNQWNELPIDYKTNMINGIVAFEVIVSDVQGKKKLSQNRSKIEKETIIENLSKSTDTNEQLIGTYMKKL
jgi:transcriptional regulator